MADYKEWEILKIQSTSLPRFHAVVYIIFFALGSARGRWAANMVNSPILHMILSTSWLVPSRVLTQSFSRTFALGHLSLTHDWGTFRKGREETRNREKGTTVFQMGLIDAQHVSKQTFIILVKQLAQDNSHQSQEQTQIHHREVVWTRPYLIQQHPCTNNTHTGREDYFKKMPMEKDFRRTIYYSSVIKQTEQRVTGCSSIRKKPRT